MGTTMELAIVLVVKRTKCPFRQKTGNSRTIGNYESHSRVSKGYRINIGNESENCELNWLQNPEKTVIQNSGNKKLLSITETTNKIDFASFCVFLSTYVIFNCIYFARYM